jgi:hypothetical protein
VKEYRDLTADPQARMRKKQPKDVIWELTKFSGHVIPKFSRWRKFSGWRFPATSVWDTVTSKNSKMVLK